MSSTIERMSARQKSFKKGLSVDDSRRRRGETTIKVRKSKREENLRKKRNLAMPTFASEPAATNQEPKAGGLIPAVECLPALATAVRSEDPAARLQATQCIRKLLSKEHDPPVNEVLAARVLPELISFLSCHENTTLQFEACWALTNIASTEHTKAVVEAGIMPHLGPLLLSASGELREQAIWCLGNISGDCIAYRDGILSAGALSPLLQNITQPHSTSLLRNATWCLSNFCRGKPRPCIQALGPALPVLAALCGSADAEVATDACWALSYLSDGDDSRIQAVVDTGVLPAIISLLSSGNISVATPALRIVGNIVSGNDKQTQAVLDCGAMAALLPLLGHAKKALRKEACWTISNITAGTRAQISTVLSCADALPALVGLMNTDEWDVKKEASWAVANVCTGGDAQHVAAVMAAEGVCEALEGLLRVPDVRMVLLSLDAISNILATASGDASSLCGGGSEAYMLALEEAGVSEALEDLQQHENEEIYNKAVKLVEDYFAEDEGEDENALPNTAADQKSFSFAAPAAAPLGQFSFNFGN